MCDQQQDCESSLHCKFAIPDGSPVREGPQRNRHAQQLRLSDKAAVVAICKRHVTRPSASLRCYASEVHGVAGCSVASGQLLLEHRRPPALGSRVKQARDRRVQRRHRCMGRHNVPAAAR